MAPTGFTMEPDQAVSLDAPTVESLRGIARRHGAWLIAGTALREGGAGDRLTNAALAIAPSGEIAAMHRKQRLFAYGRENEHYRAGTDSTLVTIDGVRIGLLVCYELRFPELFGAIANEVDAIIVIANWPSARRAHWDLLLRARAVENQCAVIGVNRTGSGGGIDYDGGSAAWGPWGDPLETLGPGEPRIVRIDTAEVVRVRERYPFLRDRG
jgi:omega-amidase